MCVYIESLQRAFDFRHWQFVTDNSRRTHQNFALVAIEYSTGQFAHRNCVALSLLAGAAIRVAAVANNRARGGVLRVFGANPNRRGFDGVLRPHSGARRARFAPQKAKVIALRFDSGAQADAAKTPGRQNAAVFYP